MYGQTLLSAGMCAGGMSSMQRLNGGVKTGQRFPMDGITVTLVRCKTVYTI